NVDGPPLTGVVVYFFELTLNVELLPFILGPVPSLSLYQVLHGSIADGTDENLLEGIDEFVVSLCEILEVIAGYFRPFVYKAERVLLHAFRLHAFGDVLDFFFGGFIFFLRFVQIGLLQELLYAGTRLPEQYYDDRFFALE